jgi:hypothetical protein
MVPESHEEDMLFRVDALFFEFSKETVLMPADGGILPVHDDPGQNGIRVVKFSFETGHQRNDDIDFEWLFLFNCVDDLDGDGVDDLIFDC